MYPTRNNCHTAVQTKPEAAAFKPLMTDRAIDLSRHEEYRGSRPILSKMPGENIPMYPRKAPRMREGVEKGRARKPRATAKLKLGPGKACLNS